MSWLGETHGQWWVQRLRGQPTTSEDWGVFGDWLDARGDVRGEMIGLARRLSRSDDPREKLRLEQRLENIEEQHLPSWNEGLESLSPPQWWCGFLLDLEFTWSRQLPALLRVLSTHSSACFLCKLSLSGMRRKVPEEAMPDLVSALQGLSLRGLTLDALPRVLLCGLAELPSLSSLRSLHLSFMNGTRELEGLLRSEHLSGLQALHLQQQTALDAQGAAVIASSARFASLTQLRLSNGAIGDKGVISLAQSPHLRSLVDLALDKSSISAEGAAALASSPNLASVQELSLRSNDIGEAGVRALFTSTGLPSLRRLGLGFNKLGPGSAIAMATSPLLGQLEELDLTYNPLQDQGAQALVKGSAGSGWRSLLARLSGPQSPQAPLKLVQLRLEHTSLTSAGASALLGSPCLPALQELVLAHNQIQDLDLPETSAGPRLVRLYLGSNQLSDRTVATLLKRLDLSRLERLDLSGNPITDQGAELLEGRQGLQFLLDGDLSPERKDLYLSAQFGSSPPPYPLRDPAPDRWLLDQVLPFRLREIEPWRIDERGAGSAPAALAGSAQDWQGWAEQLRGEPEESAAWTAFAAWLSSIGDARGEMIRLSGCLRQSQEIGEHRRLWEQLRDLEEQHSEAWLAGLDLRFCSNTRWWNGFLMGAGLHMSWPRAQVLLSSLREHPSACLFHDLSLCTRLISAGPEAHPALAALAALPLRHLSLDRCPLPLAEALASSPSLAELQQLSLNDLDAPSLSALLGSPHLTGLPQLSVRGFSLDASGMDALASSACIGSLSALHIHGKLDARGAEILSGAPLRSVSVLSIEHSELGAAGAAALASSPNLTSVQKLSLRSNDIGEAGARALFASTGLPSLRKLDLGFNGIGADGSLGLGSSPLLQQLETLTLAFNPLSDQVAEQIGQEGSQSLPLVELNLHKTALTSAGAQALARSARLGRLASLYLSSNPLGGEGAAAILGSQTLSSLRNLILDNSEIEELGALPMTSTGPRLARLGLSGNKLGGLGLAQLLERLDLSELELLDLKDNPLSKGSAALLDGRPKLRVLLGTHTIYTNASARWLTR